MGEINNIILLESLVENANDGIIITKAELGEGGPEIIYVNKAFADITGYSKEEVIGKTPKMLQGEDTCRETLEKLKKAISNGKPFKGELKNYGKNGREYWLDISIVPIFDDNGVITNYAAIERDITDKKKEEENYRDTLIQLKRASIKAEASSRDLQEELASKERLTKELNEYIESVQLAQMEAMEAKKKADLANKAKSDFLANMSHELRTPMNGVMGMSHLLGDTPLNVEQQEYVETISNSAGALLALLNDILDFSKIEAGELIIENIAFDLKKSVQHSINLLQPIAENKNVSLISYFCESIPDKIFGDPGRVKQIVNNLVSNAIKFTEQGMVRLDMFIENEGEKKYLNCKVEDTGIGIPEDKIEDVFAKFTQADASITRKYGGTGLGLAITKQLVELMDGEIGLKSVVGRGSVFWFKIPIEEAISENKDSIEEELNIEENRKFANESKILIVEDYPVNQIFAKKLLGKFGYMNIDLAENGIEAVEKMQNNQYDCVFMDCQMPEMDGFQATRNIRTNEINSKEKRLIIAMTANAMVGDREKCLEAGMNEYISKPLNPERLKTLLSRWFIFEDKEKVENDSTNINEKNKNPAVNMEQLRMFTDDDPDEEAELIEMFCEQADISILDLEDSLEDSAKLDWKSAAHKIKGSSGNLGADALYQLCLNAEQNFESAKDRKMQMLNDVKIELGIVKDFLGSISSGEIS